MQARKHGVEKENERLIAKLEKVKAENVSLQTMLQKERYGIFLYYEIQKNKICNLTSPCEIMAIK